MIVDARHIAVHSQDAIHRDITGTNGSADEGDTLSVVKTNYTIPTIGPGRKRDCCAIVSVAYHRAQI